jgi:uncharacterized protein (DUF1015 family)
MTRPDLAVPFAGERYAASEHLSRLIAPPYDVISPADRARYAAQDAHNIVHVMLPEAPSGDRYARAAELLARWRRDGTLARDPEPSVYVLAQGRRMGVFVALAAEGYEPRRVRPHERTHAGPKADRLALLRATRANLESIFVIAPDADGALAAALREVARAAPDAEAELGGVPMRLWAVAGAPAARIAALCGAAPVYIADGHHRYETASTYAQEDARAARLLSLVVSARDEGLVVLPTHRVIYGAPVHPDALGPAWSTRFDMTSLPSGSDLIASLRQLAPRGVSCVVVWPDGRADAMTVKPGTRARAPEVAVAVIEEMVVKPIVQQASTAELTYTADAPEAIDAVWKNGAAAAVLLNPTKVEEVFSVADAGGVMPPKSTYFVPKVPAGLVLADWR